MVDTQKQEKKPWRSYTKIHFSGSVGEEVTLPGQV
jgi:hypothetical protein